MSGIYGTIRPANINISTDVEILYYYRPTRSTESDDFTGFKSLDSSCLVEAKSSSDEGGLNILGLYTLKLPVDKFNLKGFYTVYIRPKEIKTTLADVSVLASYPSIRGIVVNSDDFSGIDDLTGYRVEYYSDEDSGTRSNTVRLITSSNYATPVSTSISDSYPKTTRYKLVDGTSSYFFCTLTPSSASSFRANYAPYIGTPNENVIITNTKFNPILLEIEMVDHDIDTLSYMVEGDQVRDRDNAVITTYNDDHEIYDQHEYYTTKDSLGNPLYDVKVKKEVIEESESYDNIVNNN